MKLTAQEKAELTRMLQFMSDPLVTKIASGQIDLNQLVKEEDSKRWPKEQAA
jgi:hypothetical protein